MNGEIKKNEDTANGLAPDRTFVRPKPNADVSITNSEGKKIKIYRYIDK